MAMWSEIQRWLADAQCSVEVLAPDPQQAAQTVQQLVLLPESTLGSISTHTGGILLDRGWLRLLGSGNARLQGTLLTWNGAGLQAVADPLADAFLFAHDAVGGFFALNGGAFSGASDTIHYFAPDTLEWEPLHDSYADFLSWAVRGSLDTFYADSRWPGWQDELATLNPDRGYSIYPPLWSVGPDILERSRRAVPMTELWSLQRDLAGQLANLPDGTAIRLRLSE
jgi:hypothetical protein